MRKTLTHLLCGCLLMFGSSHAHDHSRATYLGNAGILVEQGETKVLFDAFYSVSYDTYTLVPDPILEDLMAGTPPYDGIDAVFVSHVHGDHFSAAPAVAYLRQHATVMLYGSQQVRDAIVQEVGEQDPLLARVTSADLEHAAAPMQFELGAMRIDVVAIPHSGSRSRDSIQNLAWRVSLADDLTVMHLGDAGTVLSDFEQQATFFAARQTALAFPPYWFLGNADGEVILEQHIRAGQVIGVHVPAMARGEGDAWRDKHGGDLFTDPGEQRSLGETSHQH